TIDAPVARVFARPWVRRGLAALALAGAAAVVAFPRTLIDVAPAPWPQVEWRTLPTPLYEGLLSPLALVTYVFGLVVSISAFRAAAPGTVARARARAYVRAFVVYDAGWVLFIAWYTLYGRSHIEATSTLWMASVFPAAIDTAWVALIGLGILRTQLFDMDVRIKWTLRRGTVAAVFVAVFFVVAQLAQAYLSTSLGLAVGAVATGLLLFALRPIERLAAGFADRAMPNVHDPGSGDVERRRATYRAAVELALADGVVTRDEERALARLATLCGLSYEEADALRDEVEATGAPGRAAPV
ncbi:MAG TPA: hypothetical protein VI997_01205, partial [Candidatus Thermoplasmatota archaeon]|nr:hypothetical protein [Candidatus Thermoplasmatota archaeon]